MCIRDRCGLARAEQRQVLIPHGVERHHAARGRVGERRRVGGGWLVLFELPAMLVTCLEIWGLHDVYPFHKHLLHYGRKHAVTSRFVATNHRGPVPKVTEPAPFCDLICQEVRRFEFRVSDQDLLLFF